MYVCDNTVCGKYYNLYRRIHLFRCVEMRYLVQTVFDDFALTYDEYLLIHSILMFLTIIDKYCRNFFNVGRYLLAIVFFLDNHVSAIRVLRKVYNFASKLNL